MLFTGPGLFIQPGHPHSQLRQTKAASCPGPYISQMKAKTRIKHLWSRSLFLPLKSYFFKQIVQEKSSVWKQLTSLGYPNFCAEGSGSSHTFSGSKWWPITQHPANSTLSTVFGFHTAWLSSLMSLTHYLPQWFRQVFLTGWHASNHLESLWKETSRPLQRFWSHWVGLEKDHKLPTSSQVLLTKHHMWGALIQNEHASMFPKSKSRL